RFDFLGNANAHRPPSKSSWPGLTRPSSPTTKTRRKHKVHKDFVLFEKAWCALCFVLMDGRVKPGHDEGQVGSGKLRRGEALREFRCVDLAGGDGVLAAIIVKAAARLAADPAGVDIFYQQRAGPVFRIGKPLIEHLHDRKAGVETDEIGKLQRAHR